MHGTHDLFAVKRTVDLMCISYVPCDVAHDLRQDPEDDARAHGHAICSLLHFFMDEVENATNKEA